MPPNAYPLREEVLHAVTHGVGALLAVAALVTMVTWAAAAGAPVQVVATAIFGTSLVAMYGASTVYHAVPARHARTKRALQVADHCCIYLLIAGTYTPFTLISLQGAWGWSLFGVVWGLALLGIVFKLTPLPHHPWLSSLGYLGIGWIAVVAMGPLMDALPATGLGLVVAGGLAYTIGVLFYVRDHRPYHHTIWHLFVLAGSTCHYLAVQLYVLD
ncbi:MAG: PAQR family membrane homeostasis protein TrhA [Myxococcota bacterium]